MKKWIKFSYVKTHHSLVFFYSGLEIEEKSLALVSLRIIIVLLNRLLCPYKYEKHTGTHGEGEVLITNAGQDKY